MPMSYFSYDAWHMDANAAQDTSYANTLIGSPTRPQDHRHSHALQICICTHMITFCYKDDEDKCNHMHFYGDLQESRRLVPPHG